MKKVSLFVLSACLFAGFSSVANCATTAGRAGSVRATGTPSTPGVTTNSPATALREALTPTNVVATNKSDNTGTTVSTESILLGGGYIDQNRAGGTRYNKSTTKSTTAAEQTQAKIDILQDRINELESQIAQKADARDVRIIESQLDDYAKLDDVLATEQAVEKYAKKSDIQSALDARTTSLRAEMAADKTEVKADTTQKVEAAKTDMTARIANAKTEAISAAGDATTEKLRNYATTADVIAAKDSFNDSISAEALTAKGFAKKSELDAQRETLQTAINQAKTDAMTDTTTKVAAAKTAIATDIATAKTEAIAAADTSVTNKLQSYATTEQLNTLSANIGDAVSETSLAAKGFAKKSELDAQRETLQTAINQAKADAMTDTATKVAAAKTAIATDIATAKAAAISDAEGKIATARNALTTDIATAKAAAISAADTSVTNKLQSYATTAQLDALSANIGDAVSETSLAAKGFATKTELNAQNEALQNAIATAKAAAISDAEDKVTIARNALTTNIATAKTEAIAAAAAAADNKYALKGESSGGLTQGDVEGLIDDKLDNDNRFWRKDDHELELYIEEELNLDNRFEPQINWNDKKTTLENLLEMNKYALKGETSDGNGLTLDDVDDFVDDKLDNDNRFWRKGDHDLEEYVADKLDLDNRFEPTVNWNDKLSDYQKKNDAITTNDVDDLIDNKLDNDNRFWKKGDHELELYIEEELNLDNRFEPTVNWNDKLSDYQKKNDAITTNDVDDLIDNKLDNDNRFWKKGDHDLELYIEGELNLDNRFEPTVNWNDKLSKGNLETVLELDNRGFLTNSDLTPYVTGTQLNNELTKGNLKTILEFDNEVQSAIISKIATELANNGTIKAAIENATSTAALKDKLDGVYAGKGIETTVVTMSNNIDTLGETLNQVIDVVNNDDGGTSGGTNNNPGHNNITPIELEDDGSGHGFEPAQP